MPRSSPALGALSLCLVWFLATAAPAHAQEDTIWRAGARVSAVASGHKAVWAAGAIVSVRGQAREDVWAAGAEVDVDASAGRDIWTAGAIVAVGGEAAHDMHVTGARVTINARVGRTLRAAGARLIVGPQTEVGGGVQISGADVVFAGSAKGSVQIYGDAIRIDGRIAGDARVWGRHVTVGPKAVIEGNVRFETFNEPVIEEGAQIAGRQTVTLPQPRPMEPMRWLAGIAIATAFAVGAAFLLGLILLVLARGLIERALNAMRTAPGRSVLVGLGILILLPIAAVVLMVTIIGIPVALLTLFAMPLLLFAASVLAAIDLGDLLFNRRRVVTSIGGRLLHLIVGLVVLVLVGAIPFLGFLVWLVAVMIGLGAVWQAVRTVPAGRETFGRPAEA